MREVKVASAALGIILGVLAAVPASAWDRRDNLNPNTLVNQHLPPLVGANGALLRDANNNVVRGRVEGLTVATDNRIYAASNGAGTITNLFAFDNDGNFFIGQRNVGKCFIDVPQVPCSVRIEGSSTNVLGIRFNPTNSAALYVLDGGNLGDPPPNNTIAPQVLIVNPATGNLIQRLPITFAANDAINGIAFDGAGNAYVSDSNNGRIYRIPFGNPAGTYQWSIGEGDPSLFPALNLFVGPPLNPPPPTGITPPFGANGIEFTLTGTPPRPCTPGVTTGCALLVANTANRQILQVTCCSAPDAMGRQKSNPATVLINGVNAPDGIAIDPATNNIWVAANQSDEIVVIQRSTGTGVLPRVIAKLGDFNGIDDDGKVIGLLFPTSLAFGTTAMGQRMVYVTNSAFTGASAIDTEWTNLVTLFSVAKMPVPNITRCPGNPPQNCGLFRP
jgi:sugar lactone lactonase YvrE